MSKLEKDLEKPRRIKHIIVTVSIIAIIIIVLRFIFLLYSYSDVIVSGNSMEPTLKKGWVYRRDKTAYWFSKPKRGDVIVVHIDNKRLGPLAKRIIGLPGEKIQIKGGKVYVNDKQLAKKYISKYIEDGGIAKKPIILGKEDYFVLGDNIDNSYDSRYKDFGQISRKNIIGKIDGLSWKNSLRGLYKSMISK